MGAYKYKELLKVTLSTSKVRITYISPPRHNSIITNVQLLLVFPHNDPGVKYGNRKRIKPRINRKKEMAPLNALLPRLLLPIDSDEKKSCNDLIGF